MILTLLFLKHFLIDFPLQTQGMIESKGKYGDLEGIHHSVLHGLGTMLVLAFFIPPPLAMWIGIFDMIVHYHIDYIKMRYGTKNMNTKRFWTELGLDQFLHSLTYILIYDYLTQV